jgi:hypothetical protein
VHTLLASDVRDLLDKDFLPEVSYIKGQMENYGQRGTVRVDVLENVRNGTACVYDIKKGNADLSLSRSAEIAKAVYSHFNGVTRIIVIQVKPRR